MDSLQYLGLLFACVAITLPLERFARVYRRPARLAATLLPVVAVFAVWDEIATVRGDWWFSARFTLRAPVLGLPVEEWLFFLVVPVCALLTYEALGPRDAR
ncbi:lycopene cyclase domain-containing protein [Amycolatopsis pigmentata]|uniref:Lycopene cyclase domain-containing protein n=1 Tax=Amycolatopsis pigmentata TaxID=450801 RepID=A0ABW5G1E7_9PSEU